MKQRKPADEAGFFVVADRFGDRRQRATETARAERRGGRGESEDESRGRSFMEGDLWERVARAG